MLEKLMLFERDCLMIASVVLLQLTVRPPACFHPREVNMECNFFWFNCNSAKRGEARFILWKKNYNICGSEKIAQWTKRLIKAQSSNQLRLESITSGRLEKNRRWWLENCTKSPTSRFLQDRGHYQPGLQKYKICFGREERIFLLRGWNRSWCLHWLV